MPCGCLPQGVWSKGSMSARADALQRNAEGNAEHLRGQRRFLEAALQPRGERRQDAAADPAGEPESRSTIGDRLEQLLSSAYANAEEARRQKAHLKEVQEFRARQAAEKKAAVFQHREQSESLVPPLNISAAGPKSDECQAEAIGADKRVPNDSTEPTAKDGALSARLRAIEAVSIRNAKDLEAHRAFLDEAWAMRRKQHEEMV